MFYKRLLFIMAAIALALPVATSPAAAQLRPVYGKPIYNPESKSYFELVDGREWRNNGPNWEEAEELATKRWFGGVQGRLAIIGSPETDMFLRINLRPDQNTWFGLHYDCASKQLVWSDGRLMKKGEYANWYPQGWYSSPQWGFCVGDHLMPAYLRYGGDIRYWMLQRSPKRFYSYFVEYPTGGKVDDSSEVGYQSPKADTASAPPSVPDDAVPWRAKAFPGQPRVQPAAMEEPTATGKPDATDEPAAIDEAQTDDQPEAEQPLAVDD